MAIIFVIFVLVAMTTGQGLTGNLTADLEQWWGPEESRGYQDTRVRVARIHFDDRMIQDLRYRLRSHVPFKPPLQGSAFTYGFNSDAIQDWITYWAEEYPFKQREDFLNQFPQFKTNVQGLDIHFIWVKPQAPPNKKVLPLLLMHGWPGSIREFYEVIPLVTADDASRDFAVEVIVPCLPGFGFSDAAVRPGLSASQVGVVMRNLMHRLGFQQFYVQGGDWGSFIGSHMSRMFPKEVLGYHSNWGVVLSVKALTLQVLSEANPSAIVEPELADRLYPSLEKFSFLIEELGYLHLAATRPDTVGIALTDSPAGLLAFILEKFASGVMPSNIKLSDGGLRNTFSPEQLIDNLMIYWTTRSITTSLRLYAESFNKKQFALGLESKQSLPPTWVVQAKNEVTYQPPVILRLKYPNLLNTTVLNFGGHFLALECPGVLASSVLEALGEFQRWNEQNKLYT